MRILLAFSVFLALTVSSANAAKTEPLSLSYKTSIYTATDENTSIEAQYPKFFFLKGHSHHPVKVLNSEVRRVVHGLFKKFLTGDDVGRGLKKFLESDMGKGTFTITYKVVRADTDYASVRFKTVFDQEGGTHNLVYIYTVNFDLKSAKMMNLPDFFNPESDDLKQVLEFCTEDLENRVGSTWHKMTPKDLVHFSFDKKNFFFNFNSYKLTDNSVGSPEVKIPFEKLEGLKKDFK
jgi:hypothetical protein